MSAIHELKCWPDSFQALLDGAKSAEFRKNDRGFKVGDMLYLREWREGVDGGYTGRRRYEMVTHVLSGPAYGIPEGYTMLSLGKPDPSAIADARAQGVREAVQWLSRQGCRPNLAYLMSCELQPEIRRLSALPPDPIPGEREMDLTPPPPPHSPRCTCPKCKPAPPPTRCDNPDGPCACGAWHGRRP